MIEPLLIELKRIGIRASRASGPAETRNLLVELMMLRARLEAVRDEQGRELSNLRRNVAAMNAYRRHT
jgi:ribosomal protein L29